MVMSAASSEKSVQDCSEESEPARRSRMSAGKGPLRSPAARRPPVLVHPPPLPLVIGIKLPRRRLPDMH